MIRIKCKILIIFCLFFCQLIIAQTAPIAQDDSYSIQTNETLTQGVPGLLDNDTDADGDILSITEFLINGVTYLAGQTTNLTEGSITINADGSFVYIPSSTFNGSVPVINYTISDGSLIDNADLLITIINLFPPDLQNDYDTVEINTALNVSAPGVLDNDTDQDNNSLFIVNFSVNGILFLAGQTAVLPEGSVTINTDGSYLFVPTANYTGDVPVISYNVSDGSFVSAAELFLTVEHITDLLVIESLESCNEGFAIDGDYKVRYTMRFRNTSTARDYHANNLITNINLTNDLDAIYGSGCVTQIDELEVNTNQVTDYVNNPYPLDFDNNAINPNFLDGTSGTVFTNNAINNFTLYPRQSVVIRFCITINPFCGGRPNPTPSGSGIDFDNIFNITSSIGNDTENLLLTDFHTTEAIVSAGLYLPEVNPVVEPNGTYDYVNMVNITNHGNTTADNVNYNMGLGSFLDNGIVFNQLSVRQISGPAVTVNGAYDGDVNTELLQPNNSLASGETIVLEIYHLVAPVSSSGGYIFSQLGNSQTQGVLDGFDESTADNKKQYSFVMWSDGLGNHLDRYYPVNSATETVTSTQCSCSTLSMGFSFNASSTSNKVITSIEESPNGILEHQEITFQLTVTNTSDVVELENLQIEENLTNICSGNILSVSSPTIVNTTASTNPVLNPSFNGITDINIFDGTSGLLSNNEFITIELSVLFDEDCIGVNTINFSTIDPLGNSVSSTNNVNVNAFTDTDNDGISNNIDIDDDNDTILDVDEYNGLNPLDDNDGDLVPNYRDLNFGADINNDGIVDVFDFDNDGVPNHLDLDADNDGIFDIVEAGNITLDTDNNGMSNNSVGSNGLDDTIENDDTLIATITYVITNTDLNGNPDFLDIDADGDGIVDNIESQSTTGYSSMNNVVSELGVDTVYVNGIIPVDSDGDGVPDFLDLNSDNDIRNDIIEGWDIDSDGTPETIPANSDIDNDGLDDAFDVDNTLVNPTNGQVPTDFPNIDNPDNPERDWREINAVVIKIDDVSAIEGGDLIFTISLVAKNDNSIFVQSATSIDINLSTTNGTSTTDIYDVATAPFDYNQIANTAITIPSFTETIQFTVVSLDDAIYEQDELLTLNGTITSNNTVNTQVEGIGTINDNDNAPSITMNDSREDEGVDLQHSITISHPSSTPINLTVVTNDNVAISPEDYTAVSTNVTIDGTVDPASSNLQATFNIITLTDNLNELEEELLDVVATVTTSNVGTQDLIKTGTIVDIDPDPIVVVDDVTVEEGNPMMFTFRLLNANAEPMQNHLPINLRLETLNETATNDLDFQRQQTIVAIPALTTTLTQVVETIDDKLNESTETMLLQVTMLLINGSNSSSITIGRGTITDNDYPNLFSPNSDGKSDVFKILGIEDYPNFILNIVDRWGGKIFSYKNQGKINPDWWDGTYKGQPAVEGVYFYTLDFNDGSTTPKTGFIQLIR